MGWRPLEMSSLWHGTSLHGGGQQRVSSLPQGKHLRGRGPTADNRARQERNATEPPRRLSQGLARAGAL